MMQFPTTDRLAQLPTLLVLEETPFWFSELQRRLSSEAISIRIRCRAEDAWELLRTGHVRMLVIGSDIELPVVLRLLTRMAGMRPKPRVMALLADENRDLEWSLRELGTIDILTTPFASRDLIDVVRREFALPGSRTARPQHAN